MRTSHVSKVALHVSGDKRVSVMSHVSPVWRCHSHAKVAKHSFMFYFIKLCYYKPLSWNIPHRVHQKKLYSKMDSRAVQTQGHKYDQHHRNPQNIGSQGGTKFIYLEFESLIW